MLQSGMGKEWSNESRCIGEGTAERKTTRYRQHSTVLNRTVVGAALERRGENARAGR